MNRRVANLIMGLLALAIQFYVGWLAGEHYHHATQEDQEWTCEDVPDPTDPNNWVRR